jgi:hypothetical protein
MPDMPSKKGKFQLSPTYQGIFNQIKDHIPDTVAYIILFLSLLYCFVDPFMGGLPVGGILGVYFAQEIITQSQKFKEFIYTNGIFKGFTIIAAVAAFLITAPGIFIGLVVGSGVKFIYNKLFPRTT